MCRVLAVAILSLLSILPASLLAHQHTQSNPAPVRDPQAVSILTQSLNAAGGAQAFGGVRDFTAIGKITCFWTEQGETGTVSVKSRGMKQFRLDATLAEGVRTGVADTGGAWTRDPDGTVHQLFNQHTDNAGNAYLPYGEIAAALADPSITITDLGMVTEKDQQAHGIRLSGTFSRGDDPHGVRNKLSQRDVFIDPTTLLVVRTRDLAPLRSRPDPVVPHDITFFDYRPIDGVLFPFSVTESLNHQEAFTIKFDQVKFNGGLGDSDFKQ